MSDYREIIVKEYRNDKGLITRREIGEELVRCKDCKWFNLNKWAEVDGAPTIVGHEICDFWGGGCKTQKDGYCSYGERK